MNLMQFFTEIPLAEALGWTVLHSIWQGALIAAGLTIVLQLISKDKAELRYSFSVMALVLLLIVAGHTFRQHLNTTTYADFEQPDLTTWTESSLQHPLLSPTNEVPLEQLSYWRGLVDAHIHWVFGIWLLGFSLFGIRWVGSMLYVHRLRKRHAYPLSGPLASQVAILAKRLGISRPVALLESVRIQTPLVIGHLKPAILIPVSMLSGLAPDQLEAILAHELAHIQRHDYLVNLLQSLVEVVFFYHPAYWWIAAQIRDEREHCCDDIAVSVCGNALTYARALTELETRRMQATNLSVGLVGRKKHLLARIQRMVSPETQQSGTPGKIFFFTLLLTGLVSLAWLSPSNEQLPVVETADKEAWPFSIEAPQQKQKIYTQLLKARHLINPDSLRVLEALLAENEQQLTAAFGGFEWSIAGVDTPPPPPFPALTEMPPSPPMPAFPEMPPFPEMPAFPGSPTDSAAAAAWQEQINQYQQSYQEQWKQEQQMWQQQYKVYQEQLRQQLIQQQTQAQLRLRADQNQAQAVARSMEAQRFAMAQTTDAQRLAMARQRESLRLQKNRQMEAMEQQLRLTQSANAREIMLQHQALNEAQRVLSAQRRELEAQLRNPSRTGSAQEIEALKREQKALQREELRMKEEAMRMTEEIQRRTEAEQRTMQEVMRRQEEQMHLQEEQLRLKQEVLQREMRDRERALRSQEVFEGGENRVNMHILSHTLRKEMTADGLINNMEADARITKSGAGRYKVNGNKIPNSLRDKYGKLLGPYDSFIDQHGAMTLDARRGGIREY